MIKEYKSSGIYGGGRANMYSLCLTKSVEEIVLEGSVPCTVATIFIIFGTLGIFDTTGGSPENYIVYFSII